MKPVVALVAALSLTAAAAFAAPEKPAPGKSPSEAAAAPASVFTPRTVKSTGTVSVEGRKIDYDAMAGRIIVHPKGWDDATKPKGGNDAIGTADGPPVASMFYVAYFKHGVEPRTRPITFLYNGGPGSATIWLHMGAFGPKRVVTTERLAHPCRALSAGRQQLQPARRSGPGVHRRAGHRLQPHRRQGQGEGVLGRRPGRLRLRQLHHSSSCRSTGAGTRRNTCSARATARRARPCSSTSSRRRQHRLQRRDPAVADPQLRPQRRRPESNPGVDLPYELALPTYAATAWYHTSSPNSRPTSTPSSRRSSSSRWATTRMRSQQGATSDPSQRNAIAEKLHDYTGLPVAYIKKADPAHQRRRVREAPAGRRGPDHGPPRHALLGSRRWIRSARMPTTTRSRRRSARPMSRRSTTTRAARSTTARDKAFKPSHQRLPRAGTSSTSRPDAPMALPHHGQRDARPRQRDEVQPEPQGLLERRLLRPRDALLRGHLRDASPRRSRRSCSPTSNTTTTSRVTWSMPTRPR